MAANWLVTGATGGVGLALAQALAQRGCSLLVTARRGAALSQTREKLLAAGASEVIELPADFTDLDSIRCLARQVSALVPALDGVVHAAGILSFHREEGASGIEKTLCINYLAPFLLNRLLEDRLTRRSGTRILMVAGSEALLPRRYQLPPSGLDRGLSGPRQAVDAMILKMAHARALADRWSGGGPAVWPFHPGLIQSRLFQNAPALVRFAGALVRPFFSVRCREGERLLEAPLPPESGWLVEGGRSRKHRPRNLDPALVQEIERRTEALCGLESRETGVR